MRAINTLKGITLAAAFFLNINFIYAQVTIDSAEPPKEEKVVLKAVPYDSLNDLTVQQNKIDYNQYIGLKLYLPPLDTHYVIIFPEIFFGHPLTNKYYTIIDVFIEGLHDSAAKHLNSVIGMLSHFGRDNYYNPIFVLRNDSNKDTLYWEFSPDVFILVPYFVKQKHIYQNQYLYSTAESDYDLKAANVERGEKWLCTDVTLIPPYNCISYKIKNDKGEQRTLDNGYIDNNDIKKAISYYITEKDYIKREEDKKLQQQERINRQKEEERKVQETQEKYKRDLVTKYGQHTGELIAEGKVEIGMTTEMCQVAWGEPWDIEKTTTASSTDEHWFYSWKYNLYFENDRLVKIEH